MAETYHKYVFDIKKRKFVGKFEDMYSHEDILGFDSWYQEDMNHLSRQISLAILNKYSFRKILDLGCGKGVFTSFLIKRNNKVVGIDMSPTAIEKAKKRFKGIDFICADAFDAFKGKKYDLIVMMEILSYIKDYKKVIKQASKTAEYIFISLYIPKNPIGYVKSADDIRKEVSRYYKIEHDVLMDKDHIFIMAKTKKGE